MNSDSRVDALWLVCHHWRFGRRLAPAHQPAHSRSYIRTEERHRFRIDTLEALMCCGSALGPPTKRDFWREFGCELVELYGLTEGLITILQPEDLERKILSVGKPVLGIDIRILGDDDREVAAGQTGEIVGRGRLVMA